MRRSFLGLLLACAASLLTGAGGSCVDFDGQLVIARRDAGRDRLDMLLVYRNIHSTEADTSQALEQAQRLYDGARWIAFIENWPFMFDLDRLLEADTEGDVPALLQAFDLDVEVEPGELWLDETDGLCGWQLMRLRDLEALTDAANTALREVYLADDAKELVTLAGECGTADEASVSRARKALEDGWPLLRWEGSSLSFVFPATESAWIRLKRCMLSKLLGDACDACRKTDGEPLDDAQTARFVDLLAGNEWGLTFHDGAIVARLGDPAREELRLVTPPNGAGAQKTSLVEAFRARGFDIADEDLDPAALAAFEAWVAAD